MTRKLTYSTLLLLIGTVAWVGVSPPIQSSAPLANLDWPNYGNDLANSRFQNVDQINTSNVANLRPAWIFHTGVLDPVASLEVSPLVVNGVMYVTDGHDDVFALDAATGQQKWAYTPTSIPNEMPPLDQISVCCGRNNRGVAFGNGKVFLGRLDDVLVALDASTGAVVWKTTMVDFHDRFSITMAPKFVNGLVIVGVSGGEYKVRGQVAAFSADTGNEVWRFFTTQPGTWGGNSWRTGGAPVWESPAIDPELGLVYINTGNAAPDINGLLRIGDNLFSASIVALNLNTGQHVWHFQEVHHDLWDYDSAQPTLLFTLVKDGQTFPALGHCSKNGNYYILDRRTGEPLYSVKETAVPTQPRWQHASPTQPVSSVEPLTPLSILAGTVDSAKLPPGISVAPQYTPPQPQVFLIEPGDDGGCEWPPAAFSPRTNFVYYGTRYEPSIYKASPGNIGANQAGQFLGSMFTEHVSGVTDFGLFGATDTTTGKVVWKIRVDQPPKSGLLVAGDLVFFGEGNGKFHAADARTGNILFTFDGTSIPNGGGAQASAVAYVVAGREFVTMAFGGNVPGRSNFPPNPVGDAIITFALPQ